MRKIIIAFVLLVFSSGCATVSLTKFAADNQKKVSGLEVGMNKDEVLKIAGTAQVRSGPYDFYTTVKNPYLTEILKGPAKTVEVVYYFTQWSSSGVWEKRQITKNELTPLIFEDNRLVAKDWDALREMTYEYQLKEGPAQ